MHKEGDKVMIAFNVQEERKAIGLENNVFKSGVPGIELIFVKYDGKYKSTLHNDLIRVCRVTGTKISYTGASVDISEFLIPETALFTKTKK